ncbi:MAG: hypothetical protein J3Q66DRAFT_373547 [Benniella sp.]|nr:MAG: hypothetical protein J3Q66DRAFT_373547 [Benniella sp.]
MDTFGLPQACSPTFQPDTSPDPAVPYVFHFGETYPHNTVLAGQFNFLTTSFAASLQTPSSPLEQLFFPFLTSPQHVPFQASPPPQPCRELDPMTHDPPQPTASWNAEPCSPPIPLDNGLVSELTFVQDHATATDICPSGEAQAHDRSETGDDTRPKKRARKTRLLEERLKIIAFHERHQGTMSMSAIIKALRVPRATVYRIIANRDRDRAKANDVERCSTCGGCSQS